MKVGDRVICINPILDLVQNQEYTISRVSGDGGGVNVVEILDMHGYWDFHIWRFRKLETYKAKENCVNFNIVEEGVEKPEKVTV